MVFGHEKSVGMTCPGQSANVMPSREYAKRTLIKASKLWPMQLQPEPTRTMFERGYSAFRKPHPNISCRQPCLTSTANQRCNLRRHRTEFHLAAREAYALIAPAGRVLT